MNSYLAEPQIRIVYIFDTTYVDYCHPQNPECITGQTCPNCLDTYNPYIIVAGEMITESNQVFSIFTGAKPLSKAPALNIDVFPNPSHGSFSIRYMNNTTYKPAEVNLIDISGKTLRKFHWNGQETTIAMPGLPKGLYVLQFNAGTDIEIKKLMVQ